MVAADLRDEVEGSRSFQRMAAGIRACGIHCFFLGTQARIAGKGRILIRKSGTEPLVRVMAECEDEALLSDVVSDIVRAVEAAV